MDSQFFFFAFFAFASLADDRSSSLLEGHWSQVCRNGKIKTQQFENQNSTMTEQLYKDRECQEPLMTFRNDGTFALEGNFIDFRFTRVGLRINDDELRQKFAAQKVCGFADWQLEKTYDVTGRPCDFFLIGQEMMSPLPGDMRYGVFRLKMDEVETLLFFSKATLILDGTRPDKRPVELDAIPYRKLNGPQQIMPKF